VRCVVLSGGATRVATARAQRLDLAPDADDAAWRAAVVAALTAWRKENVLPDVPAVVTAPSAHTLIRALKVPSATLLQTIAEEAKQQLPFALEELDWDYVVVDTQGDQSSVSLAAVKKTIVADVMDICREAGITIKSIESGAFALGNVVLNAAQGNCESPVAVLSIEADASNLTIVDGSKLWMRTLPVNGASLVSGLAKGLSLDYAQARETLFKEVGLAGPQEGDSDSVKNVRASITRLVVEMTRSYTFYRSQLGGEKPARLLITGCYSAIQGLQEFLADRLKMDVAALDVFQGLEGGVSENAIWYAEALGCAISGAGAAAYQLNLLPKDILAQRRLNRRKPFIIAAAYLLVAMFAALYFLALQRAGAVKDASAQARAKFDAITAVKRQVDNARKEVEQASTEAEGLRRLLWERDLYPELLMQIYKIFPSNVWLSGIETISYRTIQDQEFLALDPTTAGRIKKIEDEEILDRTVRLLLRGGCYGNWTELMPQIESEMSAIKGVAGFKQRGLTRYQQYSEFELDLDLDWDDNGTPDVTDIKTTYGASSSPR
jgi:type IV pilus assembly protein PilM